MSKLILSLLFLSLGAQAASEEKTKVLTPVYEKRPIMSLLMNELNEPPLKQIQLSVDRATRICEYFKLPSGSYRSRRAEEVLTRGFRHDGKLAVLERKSGGISPRLLQIAKTERPQVVKSMRCVGVK